MNSGKHLQFTRLTMDKGLTRVKGTAGEPAWHRKWLIGYENMLRSLGTEFASLTLPYWNIFEDSAMRLSSRARCLSIAECSSYLTAMGGSVGDDYSTPYAVEGEYAHGNCVNKSVAAAACTDPRGLKCEHCIPRGDWDIEESTFEFGPSAFVEVLRVASGSKTPMETLRLSMATRFHYNLHNLLGGVYETRAAAFDPIYIGH
jgi:tyrosinase